MAETNKRKKSSAKGTKTAAKKSSSAKNGGMVTATAASKAPQKSKTAASSKPSGKSEMKKTGPATGASTRKPAKVKDEAQQAIKIQTRRCFSEHFLPYIFAGLALIFAVFLVLNLLEGAGNPATHPAGMIGYYFCQVLFGCFGWAAWLLPLLFLNFAIFWRRYCREHLVPMKVIIAALLVILISSYIHVGVCAKNPELATVYDPLQLYRSGTVFESGGVVGGLLGCLLYAGLKLPGTIALGAVSLPLLVMLFVGVTPDYVFGRLWASIKAHREIAAEEREIRREEKRIRRETETYEPRFEHRAETEEIYRRKREQRNAKPRSAENSSDEQEWDEDDEPSDPTPSPKSARSSKRHTALVDVDTGEVLENPEPKKGGADVPPVTVDERDDDDDDTVCLPFFEPTPSYEKTEDGGGREKRSVDTDATQTLTASDNVSTNKKRFGKDRRQVSRPTASDTFADDESDLYDDTPDSMVTDLDEEADLLFEDEDDLSLSDDASSGGNFAVVYKADRKSYEGMTVTINRQEFDAVAESGLSEEELVLSTAHDPADLHTSPKQEYQFPSVEMLTRGSSRYEANDDEIAENTRLLREVLESFHIRVKEISCSCGPTITRFEVKPDTGVRVRSIANLVDDIAMNLAKAGVRIEAPIPGKAAVGIEVPNAEPATVFFRNILETPEFRNHKSRIAACLGADVSGRPVILDINKMPHLLIAGATGMGKSVCINSIVMSILYKAKPDEVKLILIDPKKVEFAMYRELPHLLCPIVSDPKQAAGTLYCAVNEMERRFGLIEEVGVRNLAGYNEITADDPERPALPQIVIIIDELADLMMTAPADVETAICRLAQKARAAGIHLVIGTQRPSVDVITGLIKANIPSRIAFTVASAVDSRTIIDTVGADKLIGRGDMLYAPVGINKPMRCQGTFVSESEVERVVTFIKENNDPVVYDEEFIKNIAVEAARCGVNKKKGEQVSIDDFDGLGGGQNLWGEEPKFWEALEVVVTKDKFGTSALQRALHLGYGKAASIIDRMEEYGFVGPDPGNKTGRDVRITHEQLRDYKTNGLPGHRKDSDDLFED